MVFFLFKGLEIASETMKMDANELYNLEKNEVFLSLQRTTFYWPHVQRMDAALSFGQIAIST